ncbi:hypothetical protein H0H92_006975, partial [Tricholoma furcatifolium]
MSLSLPSSDADATLTPSQSNADTTAPPSIPQGTSLRAIANSMHNDYRARERGRRRDEGVVFCEPARSRAGPGAGGAVGTLSRALGVQQGQGQVDGGIGIQKKTQKKMKTRTPSLRSPLFGSFLSIHPRRQLQCKPTSSGTGPGRAGAPDSTATNANTNTSSEAEPIVVRKAAASVPLESIIPATAKPPTQYLGAFTRTYTHLTSRAFELHLSTPQNATLFLHASPLDASSQDTPSQSQSQTPMTDRYGFAYDVVLYDFLLLLRAREARCVAPACLTGVKIADREEDNMWLEPEPDDGDGEGEEEEGVEIVKEGCACDGESPPLPTSKFDGAGEAQTQPDADAGSIKAPNTKSTKSTKSRVSSSKSKSKNTPSLGRKRFPTVTA